jgi:hypothetical protein
MKKSIRRIAAIALIALLTFGGSLSAFAEGPENPGGNVKEIPGYTLLEEIKTPEVSVFKFEIKDYSPDNDYAIIVKGGPASAEPILLDHDDVEITDGKAYYTVDNSGLPLVGKGNPPNISNIRIFVKDEVEEESSEEESTEVESSEEESSEEESSEEESTEVESSEEESSEEESSEEESSEEESTEEESTEVESTEVPTTQPPTETPTEPTTEAPTEVVTEEETPLGAATFGFNFDEILEPVPEEEEELVLDEIVPLGDALPQTGQLPPELYYGLGSVISLAGLAVRRRK